MRKWMLVIVAVLLVGASVALAQDDGSGQGGNVPLFVGVDVFERGLQAFQEAQFDQAITDFSLFLLLNPTSAQGYFLRGVSYQAVNDIDSALIDLNRALALPSPSAEFTAQAHLSRAAIYAGQEQVEAALADFDAAVEALPDAVDAYDQRGQYLFIQERYDQAVADFARIIALEPDNLTAYARRGLAYASLENYSAALRDFDYLIRQQPSVAAYFERARVYLAQENYDAALEDLSLAIAQDENQPGLYLSRASAHTQLGNAADAANDYLNYIRLIFQDEADAAEIRPGESQVVEMEAGQVFTFAFVAEEGQRVTISATTPEGVTADPLLILADTDFNPLIASDDISTEDFDSLIADYVLPADGIYRIILSHAAGGSEGPVRVRLTIDRAEQ